MKKIITSQKFDINTAVNFAANEIHLGARGFFVDTQFGYIPVEVVNARPAMDNSFTSLWKDAPATDWVIKNRNGDYKVYVRINYIHGQDIELTRRQLIREFCTVIYANLKGNTPFNDDLLVLYYSYTMSYRKDDREMSSDNFIKKYVNANIGGKIKLHSTIESMKTEIRSRINAETGLARMIAQNYYSTLRREGFMDNSFGNQFYDILFAMCAKNITIDTFNSFLKLMGDETGGKNVNAYDVVKLMIDK